jgi:hypothetical protein
MTEQISVTNLTLMSSPRVVCMCVLVSCRYPVSDSHRLNSQRLIGLRPVFIFHRTAFVISSSASDVTTLRALKTLAISFQTSLCCWLNDHCIKIPKGIYILAELDTSATAQPYSAVSKAYSKSGLHSCDRCSVLFTSGFIPTG